MCQIQLIIDLIDISQNVKLDKKKCFFFLFLEKNTVTNSPTNISMQPFLHLNFKLKLNY